VRNQCSENYTAYQGLCEDEVKKRFLEHGANELPESQARNFLVVSQEVITEPMFLLLVSCCILYLILGDLQEALTLSVFVLVIIGITLFQSWKTEKALAALKDLSSPKALVIRNGASFYIPSRELVIGDIVIINEGDKVPADAVILESINLMVDESLLTGESVPVSKYEPEQQLVYSGTSVTQGMAYLKITATGANTQLGKIGSALESITKSESRFQKEVSHIVKVMLSLAISLCIIIVIFAAQNHGLVQGLLTAITCAIATLPEEVPAVLTIFMALGAWRISQKKVLTRKMSAIETLGSISVLCTDKTGTITENKMVLSEVFIHSGVYKIDSRTPIPEDYHPLIEFALLASKDKSFDPMEQALRDLISSKLVDSDHIHLDWQFIQEYSLSKDLLAMSRAWDSDNEKLYSFYSKGSPEAIFDLCHLPDTELVSLNKQVETMASCGLRVLGVAKSKAKLGYLPSIQHDIDFEFCGLLGFYDPIREGVKEAIANCQTAGIRVIMITGDHPITAQNIAKEIGLKNTHKLITGSELNNFSNNELQEKIKDVVIFSRVIPEQKLRIVEALKKNNEVVAMTGDGVNDAPALKASDVGIAMGLAGTNVAREAADLVLLDDNFSSTVSAIRSGRRIFSNLRKAISYILAIHIPIAGLTLVPVLLPSLPTIFFPIHVAFLELIIDPTCSVVFEAEPAAKDIMRKAPRSLAEPILNKQKVLISILQGSCLLLAVLAVYFYGISSGRSDTEIRFASFISLIIGNFILALLNKSWRGKSFTEILLENRMFVLVSFLTLIILSLIAYLPNLRSLFYFS